MTVMIELDDTTAIPLNELARETEMLCTENSIVNIFDINLSIHSIASK